MSLQSTVALPSPTSPTGTPKRRPVSMRDFTPLVTAFARSVQQRLQLENPQKRNLDEKQCLAICDDIRSLLRAAESTLSRHQAYAHRSSKDRRYVLECVELFLYDRLYFILFAFSPMDRQRDDALALRFRQFEWIKPHHLELPDWTFSSSLYITSIEILKTLHTIHSPKQSLHRLLQACRVLHSDLNKIADCRPSADLFFPVFILVCLRARPLLLHCALQYMKFATEMTGEEEYWCTHLTSVLIFIEQLSMKHLKIAESEWNLHMASVLTNTHSPIHAQHQNSKPSTPPTSSSSSPDLHHSSNHPSFATHKHDTTHSTSTPTSTSTSSSISYSYSLSSSSNYIGINHPKPKR